VNDDLKIRLIELLEEEEIFLKKDLTLSKTALLLKTNTSYLSGLINKEFSCKFNQFINKYRVAKACELLVNTDMDVYSIEGIADLSGFKSKSVFNLEFKSATGVHPSTYRKTIK
jgi:AraC-like DNA-binding protein